LNLEARSFTRYIVEVALPRVEGPGGSDLLGVLREVVAEEDRTVRRLVEMIVSLDSHPELGSYGFVTGFYNYLRVDYLAGVVADRMRAQLGRLRELESTLEGESAAQAILRDAVLRKEGFLDKLVSYRPAAEEAAAE
jgi:hypothetical protein